MSEELKGSMACDGSALLEMVFGTPSGVSLKERLASGIVEAQTTEIAVTEVFYIMCRKHGKETAAQRVKMLLDSGFARVCPTERLVEQAAFFKCKRLLSIADCFTLALAENLSIPALFAARERELVKEMSREPFDVKIIFLR